MSEKLAVAKKIPLRAVKKTAKKAPSKDATGQRPMVSSETARICCRRIVAELVDLADERQRQKLYLEALDNAIRAAGVSATGHAELNALRSSTMARLSTLEYDIQSLLASLDR